MQMNLIPPYWADDLGDVASFTFVDAPWKADDDRVPSEVIEAFGSPKENNYYEWWRGHIVGSPDRVYFHEGMDKSLATLRRVWEEQGPFDGIFGFSQGAAMASVVAMGVKAGDPRFEAFSTLRVLIAFSGWVVRGAPFAVVYRDDGAPGRSGPPLRAYISAGKKDRALPATRVLADTWHNASSEDDEAIFEEHGGAHVVPRVSPALREMLDRAAHDGHRQRPATPQGSFCIRRIGH